MGPPAPRTACTRPRMHAVRMTQWRNSLKLGFTHLPLFLHEAAPKSIAKWSAKVINSQDREEEKGYEKEELSQTLWKENKQELSWVLAFSTPLRIRDLWGRGQKVTSRVSQQNPWKAQKIKHQLPWNRRWGRMTDDCRHFLMTKEMGRSLYIYYIHISLPASPTVRWYISTF